MFDISPIQILIVLVIALLVFGPKRLPEMGSRSDAASASSRARSSTTSRAAPAAGRRGAGRPAAGPRPSRPPAAATPDEDDDVLEGVVVPGDAPPPRPDRRLTGAAGRLPMAFGTAACGGSARDEQLSVVDHLDELRNRLIVSVLALVVAFAVAYGFHEQLIDAPRVAAARSASRTS